LWRFAEVNFFNFLLLGSFQCIGVHAVVLHASAVSFWKSMQQASYIAGWLTVAGE
jgi:hypothetical protein